MARKNEANLSYNLGLAYEPSGLVLPSGASPGMENVELHKAYLRRARGISSYSTANATGRVLLVYNYTLWDDTSFSLLVTDDYLYKYNAATDTLTSIGAYTGVDGRQVIGTTFDDLFIFTDFENVVKKSNGSTLADLGGLTATKAKTVKAFYSHLILGHVLEGGVIYPSRIKWSSTGDPEVWTGSYSGHYDLVDTQDHLVNMEELSGRFYIYKEGSIWVVVHVGGTKVFAVDPYIRSSGLIAARTLSTIKTKDGRDAHMSLGPDAVHLFDGVALYDVSGLIRPYLFGTDALLNREKVETSCSAYIASLGEYWLAVPIQDDTVPYTIFRYNIKENSWWPKRYGSPIYSLGQWEEQKELTWNDEVGDWLSASGIWGESVKGTDVEVLGTWDGANGKLKNIDLQSVLDDSSYPTAYWESRDYGGETEGRWAQFWVEVSGGGTIELFYSVDGGSSWYSLGSKAAPNDWSTLKWRPNVTSEKIRFKLKWGNADTAVRKQVLWYSPRKR